MPKIGELIGGSQREDNLEVLIERCISVGMKVGESVFMRVLVLVVEF